MPHPKYPSETHWPKLYYLMNLIANLIIIVVLIHLFIGHINTRIPAADLIIGGLALFWSMTSGFLAVSQFELFHGQDTTCCS